ncbi:MAG: class I SAM-dependent methyltransferase [Bacteroidales bacterium]
MGKFGKALKALWWIVRKPVLLNRVLTDEDNWQTYVEKKYGSGTGLPVVSMDQLIGSASVSLGPMTFLDGGSLPTDMMLLAGLAEKIPEGSYFEIGTWRGESVSVAAARIRDCHTLCLTDEQMRSMGMHERTILSHRLFSEKLENVTQWRADSREFDFTAPRRKFDLVFIDGDHHYDIVRKDTENVFQHMAHENTVVVWHDYGFHPDRVRFEVMAAILDGSGDERKDRIYHVAHTKCAIFTGEKLEARNADFPVIPEAYYQLRMERHPLKDPHHQ